MKSLAMAVSLLVFGAAAWAGDAELHSLRGAAALDGPSGAVSGAQWVDGEGKVVRNYPQQPPLIPHLIEDFTIDRDGNTCLGCHNWNSEMPGATRVAISHFVNRDGQALANISPNRYFCTQCHVPQKDAKALIANVFRSPADEEE